MNRAAHPQSPTNAPPASPGFRERVRRWITVGKTKRWWTGLGLLRFHCSLYLAMVPILFLINLIQAPAHLWIDRAALAWLALLVVHAAIVGMIWAIAIWQREAAAPERAPGATPQPRTTWITSRAAEPQDAEFRTSGPNAPFASWGSPATTTDSPMTDNAPNDGSFWAGSPPPHRGVPDHTASKPPASMWDDALPRLPKPTTPEKPPMSNERVSWRTVTDAAWLTPTEADAPSETVITTASNSDEQKPT